MYAALLKSWTRSPEKSPWHRVLIIWDYKRLLLCLLVCYKVMNIGQAQKSQMGRQREQAFKLLGNFIKIAAILIKTSQA